MNQTYQEFRKVNLILNSIQAKLDRELLRITKDEGITEAQGRPNNGILKEYNGEPQIQLDKPSIGHFELEIYQTTSRLIEEQISNILLTLENLERKKNKN